MSTGRVTIADLKQMKAEGRKIVMLTAKHRDVERETGLALGADDYITKPFSTREVISQVEALLQQSGQAE